MNDRTQNRGLRYAVSLHEWLKQERDGRLAAGWTDPAMVRLDRMIRDAQAIADWINSQDH